MVALLMNHRKILSQFLLIMKILLSENKVTLMRNTPDLTFKLLTPFINYRKAGNIFKNKQTKNLTHIITRNRLLREEVI